MITICAWCKKELRRDHVDLMEKCNVSHGICKECAAIWKKESEIPTEIALDSEWKCGVTDEEFKPVTKKLTRLSAIYFVILAIFQDLRNPYRPEKD